RTGIAIELPPKTVGLVVPRSGLALRHGISLVNAPGVVDEGYRGELRVLLLNTDRSADWTYESGERIAQLLVVRFEAPDVVELDVLSEDCARKSWCGVPLVMPSSLAAVLVVSPIAVYSSRRSEPTLPAMTGPVLMPIPMRKSTSKPSARISSLNRARRSSISREAAS